MIRFICDIYMEEFDQLDEVTTRILMSAVTGSGADVATHLRRQADLIEGAPGIFAVRPKGSGSKKVPDTATMEDEAKRKGMEFFTLVEKGEKTPEEFGLWMLEEARQQILAHEPDISEAELDETLRRITKEPEYLASIQAARDIAAVQARMKEAKSGS